MAGESSILWNRSKDPRSRVWNNSGGASFEDLLAVLLSHGHRGRNVLEVSRELIQRVGDETGLFALEPGALTGIKGIGRARATTIIAAIELARRQVGNTLVGRGRGRLRLEDAPAWLYSELAAREQEYFYLLNFNRRRVLIDWHIMGTGGYDRVEVYYRDLLRTILNDRAGIVVIAHNHPGESARPGMDDLSSMRNLERMLSDIGVALQDQFIIGEDGVYSCRQKRFLQQNHFQKN